MNSAHNQPAIKIIYYSLNIRNWWQASITCVETSFIPWLLIAIKRDLLLSWHHFMYGIMYLLQSLILLKLESTFLSKHLTELDMVLCGMDMVTSCGCMSYFTITTTTNNNISNYVYNEMVSW